MADIVTNPSSPSSARFPYWPSSDTAGVSAQKRTDAITGIELMPFKRKLELGQSAQQPAKPGLLNKAASKKTAQPEYASSKHFDTVASLLVAGLIVGQFASLALGGPIGLALYLASVTAIYCLAIVVIGAYKLAKGIPLSQPIFSQNVKTGNAAIH